MQEAEETQCSGGASVPEPVGLQRGSAHLGLASLNHIILVGSKVKGGGVPDCGTWAWGISVGEQWLQYESLINEVVGVWTLHWLVCI